MSLLSALAAWLPLQTDPSATVCGGHEAGRGPTVVLWGWGSHHPRSWSSGASGKDWK